MPCATSGLIAAVLLFLLGVTSATVASAARPNIVLIMADDLGWSDIGCYGGEIETPHIDSLAEHGLRFTQFYNNAICGPTRASLLTGLYCQQVGHRGDRWNEAKDYSKCVTLGEVLQAAGYHTAMVGKWQGRDSALDRGFDRFFGPLCQAKISYFHEVAGNPYYLDRQRVTLPADFYLTSALNARANEFIEEALAQDRPFFLYVAHIAPHWPLHAPAAEVAKFRERYRASGWDTIRATRLAAQQQIGLLPSTISLAARPPGVRDWREDNHQEWQAERMAVYAAQVAAIDHGVGQLLARLREANAVDNTLVMFLSDNGAAPDGGLTPTASGFGFGPNRRNANWRKDGVPIRAGSGPENPPGPHDTFAAYGLAWANASNTPLRGTKLEGYEGGIRTPLVIRWPAAVSEPGTFVHQPGHVIDVMPTLLDAAGGSYPSEFNGRQPLPVEGRSLLPVLRGDDAPHDRLLCWSVPRHDVIRRGDWKAVGPRGKMPWQLFDLAVDPTETTDLAGRHPEKLSELKREFHEWRQRVGAVSN